MNLAYLAVCPLLVTAGGRPPGQWHGAQWESREMTDIAQHDFGGRLRPQSCEPTSWETLVGLSNDRLAFVYQRLSKHEQVKRHIWSQEAQDALADLARKITVPHKVDFMALSSYGASTESTGEVRIIMDLREPVVGMHVLIVEDIIDTGNTVHYLQRLLKGRQPASLKTCALVKKKRNTIEVPVDYLGFTIPNVWVVGYGLDYADTYRTLPYIAELKKEVYQRG